MAESVSLPAGWNCVTDLTRHDSFMDREYTTVTYEQEGTGQRVIITDVQEPNNFGGWGFLVQSDGSDYGELGLVEDIGSARELAREFMEEYEAPPE
ncbi:hypothetical protein [Haloarcula rubripromontorii]|uniref:hypothetical protein n=1 Tax=Haloarcula rubripromontorii TaxID=1705562 RepID=UPI00345B8DC0